MHLIYTLILFIGLSTSKHEEPKEINWLSWEEAYELNKTTPKKIFVDIYTDWCGWCKKMDKSTFMDPALVDYMSENFYAVKFNAEQKEDIDWSGNTFKFVNSGRRGVHQLAYSLLNGKTGYPSFVLLDEEFSRIMISPGFKTPEDMMPELVFANQEKYKEMTWEDYKSAMVEEMESK